jgi:hypothetical protein
LSCALSVVASNICEPDARIVDITGAHAVKITVNSLNVGVGVLIVVCGTGH